MFNRKYKFRISSSIRYIMDWKDETGQYMLDHLMFSGRYILNKGLTGCGFTTYCIYNNFDMIIVSPRRQLIDDKIMQHPGVCYYFNREGKPNKDGKSKGRPLTREELCLMFHQYITQRHQNNLPLKLYVTFDSFKHLCDMLETDFSIDINSTFTIAIDESQCLITDASFKELWDKITLSDFIATLFKYDNLLFASATPIVDFIEMILEFQQNQVDYYELDFECAIEPEYRTHKCQSVAKAFEDICKNYKKQVNPQGEHYFDVNYEYGRYSTEAAIFVNSVLDIKRFVNKYVKKEGLFKTSDITIICADDPKNEATIKGIDSNLCICKDIPKRGQQHTKITLVTRAAFYGVDFESDNASTFVIANYNIPCLSYDISSDLPQIIGRQRLDENIFRNTIHMYYADTKYNLTDEEFDSSIQTKIKNSRYWLDTWESDKSAEILKSLKCLLKNCPGDYYLTMVNGFPEFNNLMKINDEYCRNIAQTYKPKILGFQPHIHSQITQAMICQMSGIGKQDRIRLVYQYFCNYPQLQNEFFQALRENGYFDIGYYFYYLPLERMNANGLDTSKMNEEIENNIKYAGVAPMVKASFVPGDVYTKKEVKSILQGIYNNLGITDTAKATDIKNYLTVEDAKKKGNHGYRIIG